MVRVRADKFYDGRIFAFCKDLQRRSLISSSYPENLLETSGAANIVKNLPSSLYAGFDPTADSLHVGNLLILSNLLRSSLFGCNAVALIGGGTALIGDPSGRSSERSELSRDIVRENSKNIVKQLAEILENAKDVYGDHMRMSILNNAEWFENLSMLEFLRVGRSFRVADMLRLGPVRSRIESGGISYAEFSYQLLQSYDWLILSRKFDCFFQLGGSDQHGHLDAGGSFIKRLTGRKCAGVCLPLLTDERGAKLGKSTASLGASVWLDASKTSPLALYQYFRQVHDDVAARFLIFFSLRPIEEVESIVEHHNDNLGKSIAQTALAEEIVTLVHGRNDLEKAVRCSKVLYYGSLNDFEKLDNDTINKLFTGPMTYELSKSKIKTVADLAEATRSKASHPVESGAFKVNGVKMVDPTAPVEISQILLKDRYSLVSWGKRNFSLVVWNA